ncbi:PREDICTED: protein SODIUM POTASSIUM ROOT DEFECTIVE 2-like [Nelumbo nucifera]|uniref:HMA domain-containing protein n=2 Tax=Nelumbo nucifera TaxID=4432 RepID=A0A822XWE1_NELNU|nr:PREDICTED: protein SODIUM POTASSIUM ROOT DEFECTIVE 2-like [Nelumbo nucifera]DAD25954.1 TPA_asm: hypothetical protein HUJ06_027422 [Nelumbo nucifera]
MKGIDLFCASPASTAICVSMDQRSMVRHGGRAIDRHNPHLRDGRRSMGLVPCSSQPSTKPKPYHQKSRKSSAKPTDLNHHPGSSRYLLSDTAFFDVLSDFDPVSALVPIHPTKPRPVKPDESSGLKHSSSARSRNQVVVLRVSLHCKGCEGKVRKHISRMEGVTSFSIDFATKKVTVVGDVTPLGVLASVSRVKNAQLWPSSSSSTSSVGLELLTERQTKLTIN